ncbi:MAG: aminomethyl-transferring glycine dehydrogenase subunit GcvPA [Anaerolineae bacterium]
MSYVPHSDADRQAMLAEIGVESVEELFVDVPEAVRYPEVKLPRPLSEIEILAELQAMSERNADLNHYACFLGAGAYDHFVPSVVGHVTGRSEFYTAYTPYQAEVSQGTLQTIFEYQSMVCALTGMEVANASHYDGATSMAEAVIMALAVGRGKRRKVIMAPTVHPEYRATVRTYTQGMGLTVVGDELPHGEGVPPTSLLLEPAGAGLERLKALVDDDTACVIVQNPDFFGQLESPVALQSLADAVHQAKALFIVSADPISLGLFKPPGEYGADVVVGEGQALGNHPNFGGPYLGYFACKQKYGRKMAGRLIGQTVDTKGRRGFVMTLVAREQHIRRERATSNICTNEALVALAAGVYLAALGRCGLRTVAELCYHKAHYAARQVGALEGFDVMGESPFFKEFVVRCPMPVAELNRHLLEDWCIVGGHDLGRDFPGMEYYMLLCVTEMNTQEEVDRLVKALWEIIS